MIKTNRGLKKMLEEVFNEYAEAYERMIKFHRETNLSVMREPQRTGIVGIVCMLDDRYRAWCEQSERDYMYTLVLTSHPDTAAELCKYVEEQFVQGFENWKNIGKAGCALSMLGDYSERSNFMPQALAVQDMSLRMAGKKRHMPSKLRLKLHAYASNAGYLLGRDPLHEQAMKILHTPGYLK